MKCVYVCMRSVAWWAWPARLTTCWLQAVDCSVFFGVGVVLCARVFFLSLGVCVDCRRGKRKVEKKKNEV